MAALQAPRPVKVRSFRPAIADRIPTFFTLGFPLFWALMLAAPRTRHLWRAMAAGTALLALLALLSLFLYTAYTIETRLQIFTSALAVALWGAAEYLNVNVAPYAAPLVMAVWLHAELRAQIFSWIPAEAPEPAPASSVKEDKRRGKYRSK